MELRLERRTGALTLEIALFALLVVVAMSLSFYVDDALAMRVAPGLYWIALTFAAVLASGRVWVREREHDLLSAVLRTGTPATAIYASKSLLVGAALGFVAALTAALISLFLHVSLWTSPAEFVALSLTGIVGLTLTGTLFGALGARSRGRDRLLSVIVLPLVSPLLIVLVAGTREALGGAPDADVGGWARFALAYDLVAIVTAAFVMQPMLED